MCASVRVSDAAHTRAVRRANKYDTFLTFLENKHTLFDVLGELNRLKKKKNKAKIAAQHSSSHTHPPSIN